jgi:hypothetical protein
MYYLFYDAVSSSDFAYITWNDRINKKWIGKDMEGSGGGLI